MGFFKKMAGDASNRPDAISVMCILLALWGASRMLSSALTFIGTASLSALIGFMLSVSILISLSALWRMRLWGVHLFLATIAINIVLTQLIPEALSLKGTIRMGATGLLAVIYMIVVIPHWNALTRKDKDQG